MTLNRCGTVSFLRFNLRIDIAAVMLCVVGTYKWMIQLTGCHLLFNKPPFVSNRSFIERGQSTIPFSKGKNYFDWNIVPPSPFMKLFTFDAWLYSVSFIPTSINRPDKVKILFWTLQPHRLGLHSIKHFCHWNSTSVTFQNNIPPNWRQIIYH